jgi:hypothetical protein
LVIRENNESGNTVISCSHMNEDNRDKRYGLSLVCGGVASC